MPWQVGMTEGRDIVVHCSFGVGANLQIVSFTFFLPKITPTFETRHVNFWLPFVPRILSPDLQGHAQSQMPAADSDREFNNNPWAFLGQTITSNCLRIISSSSPAFFASPFDPRESSPT